MAARAARLKSGASSSRSSNSPRGSPKTTRKATSSSAKAGGKSRREAARSSALNAMGGVKVDVFVRVRPQLGIEADDRVAITTDPSKGEIILEGPDGHPSPYSYDKVYGPESTQETVYDDCVAPIVEQVCRGMHCCIFAYGQTGAGKTHTMRGNLDGKPENFGIIQRSIQHLFARLPEVEEYSDIQTSCSFLEIYMEELEDLLTDPPKPTTPNKKAKNKLRLVDDTALGCRCDGLTQVSVDTTDEVMSLLKEAEKRCKFSETKMNKLSNRAHRIFRFTINFKRYDTPAMATLTFVDLAGSEDIARSGAKGLTAREASHINRSLLTLGRVINGLACNEKHIPYRDSKLTRLLSEALGGVCKTSFIACVSPSGASATETTSTLRYAERAMEALNISQLPKSKQDEIMIDGLTRRVQQLMDDLDTERRLHREDMLELQVANRELTAETKAQRRELGSCYRKIERLVARKAQLKTGYGLMTNQRDHLAAEKAELQGELLATRQARDGYLTDRETLNMVLDGVRSMRQRLLKAHSETESNLLKDATALKGAIEKALEEIEQLHTEIGRKKTMSSENEQLADRFKSDLSNQLVQLVSGAKQFKSGQASSFQQVNKMLEDFRTQRQQQTLSTKDSLVAVAADTSKLLGEIADHSSSAEATVQAAQEANRESAGLQHDMLTAAIEKLSSEVHSNLDQYNSQSKLLSDSLAQWSAQVKTKLDEQLSSTSEFTNQLVAHVSSMQGYVNAASQAQLAHLSEHADAMGQHLKAEKAELFSESERVIAEVSSFIRKVMTDHASSAAQRTEEAVNGFQTSVTSIRDETVDLVAKQNTEFDKATGDIQSWFGVSKKAFEQGQRDNNASHFGSSGMLGQADKTITALGAEVDEDTEVLKALGDEQHEHWNAVAAKTSNEAEAVAAEFHRMVGNGTRQIHDSSTQLQATADAELEQFSSHTDSTLAHLAASNDHVNTHVADQTAGLQASEGSVVTYVTKDLQRDVQDNPVPANHVYPTDYRTTEAYERILRDTEVAWEREVAINQRQAKPGKGIDFPGDLGPEDSSGLLTTTLPKAPPPTEQQALDTAARDSDADEYDDDPTVEYDPPSDEDDDDFTGDINGS
eukprot:m.192395 g.192395  ORF g.192395 m.192395 type:complete len:1106 (+) comp18268_c0_seq2:330-3647(+)